MSIDSVIKEGDPDQTSQICRVDLCLQSSFSPNTFLATLIRYSSNELLFLPTLFQAQLIAQSIGQAFQVAYMEFLKANGIEDPGLMKEIDYQDVLNQQEIYGEELNLFANKEMHKEVSYYIHIQYWDRQA